MSGLLARLCPTFWQNAMELPARRLSLCSGLWISASWHDLPWGLLLGALSLVPPTLPAPKLVICSSYWGGGSPRCGPTPAPSNGHWPGLYLLYFCCLMVAVPKLNLSLCPFPAHHPSGWNSFFRLLLLWPHNRFFIFFFRNLPVDMYRARAMVTVYLILKRSWWSEAVLNPHPVRNNYLLCIWPCRVWRGLWSWTKAQVGHTASHPRTAVFSAKPP